MAAETPPRTSIWFPITVQAAQQMGFPVTTDMPRLVYELMDLYPQANARRPSVIYVPTHSASPAKDETGAPKPAPKDVRNPNLSQ